MRICAAATVALPDAEENVAELAVFRTNFHFGLNSSSWYSEIPEADIFQIRVPPKVGISQVVIMVCTRPSTADIPAVITRWR